jgi:hypothetical protein
MPFPGNKFANMKLGRSPSGERKYKLSDAADVLLPKSEKAETTLCATDSSPRHSIDVLTRIALAFFVSSTVLLLIGYWSKHSRPAM